MFCTTCNKPAAAPRSRIVSGKIVEQCVDQIHDSSILGIPGNSAEFLRIAIKSFRKAGSNRFKSPAN